MSYLGAFGISPEEALQIWKVWGDAAVEMIRMDPYVLCREPVVDRPDLSKQIEKAKEIERKPTLS